MNQLKKKLYNRQRRHWSVRKKVLGTPERPRVSVYRSLKHIQVQIIDDLSGKTLCACSTLEPEIRKNISAKGGSAFGGKSGGNIASAKEVGKRLAERALASGIQKVVFDRGGFPYHGRIKALAETLRQGGLKF